MQAPSTAPSVPGLTVTDPSKALQDVLFDDDAHTASRFDLSETLNITYFDPEHPEGDANIKPRWKQVRDHERILYLQMKA
jgi:hypothetical protein